MDFMSSVGAPHSEFRSVRFADRGVRNFCDLCAFKCTIGERNVRELDRQRFRILCRAFCRVDIHKKIAIGSKMPKLIAVFAL